MPYTLSMALAIVAAVVLPAIGGPLAAQENHSHEEQEGDHHHALHFAHPLFTESVSPDTKLRLDFGRNWEADASESEVEVEAEYAFHRSFSIEVIAPYAFVNPEDRATNSRLGNLEVALKFANFAFEEAGLLLGYGLEVGVPTGDASVGIGSDHIWEFEPFLNLGLKRGRLELVGFSRFGIPTNQNDGEEVETELAYDVSFLFHASSRLQTLLEVNGHAVLSGEEAGEGLVSLSPGIKLAPLTGHPLFVGLAASFPLGDEELDARARTSLFYHF